MMEIGVIVIMAVLLFPAKELPKLARTIARIYGQVRKTAEDFRSAVLDDEDLREPIDQIRGAYNDARFEVRDAERKARQQLAKAQMEMRMATARRIQAERAEEQKIKIAAQEAREEQDLQSELAQEAELEQEGASPASPVQLADAANGSSNSAADAPTGPVAGSDPRKIAAARPPAYTPPSSQAGAGSGEDDQAHEGVA